MRRHDNRYELRQRWPLVLASCIGVISSSFVLPYYSIGALVVPVTEEFGWTRSEFQLAIFFSASLGALTAPVVGWLIDLYGARRIALPSMLGLGASFFLASTTDARLWTLFLAYGSMALLGAGTIAVTWTRAIVTSFTSQRGLALGLTLTGTGLCAFAAPHYVVWLTDSHGWRGAYIGLGLIPILVGFPILYLFFRPVEHGAAVNDVDAPVTSIGMTLRGAVRSYRFWVLLLSILFAYMAFAGIGTNLFASLTDDGFTRDEAATVVSVFGAAIIAGRIAVGYLIDKLWAPGVAAFSLALPAIGALVFHGDQSLWLAVCASFLIGFGAGAELDLVAFLTAKYFGLRHYAKIYSISYATLALCSGTAPFLFASVYDRAGSYDLGFGIAFGLFVLAIFMVLLLGKYPDPRYGRNAISF